MTLYSFYCRPFGDLWRNSEVSYLTVVSRIQFQEEKISPSKLIDSARQQQQGLVAYPKQENAGAKNNNGLMNIINGGSGDLQKAADKITLMSPEVFEVKPKIKEESRDEQDGLHSTPSAPPPRGVTTLNYLPSRQILAGASGTSSPSREVADILGAGDGDDEIGKTSFSTILFLFWIVVPSAEYRDFLYTTKSKSSNTRSRKIIINFAYMEISLQIPKIPC